jgi:hypothetical protein
MSGTSTRIRGTLGWLIAAGLSSGCSSPLQPTSLPDAQPSTQLAISQVSPEAGWPLYRMEIVGSGFHPGARVTLGGADVLIPHVTNTKIWFFADWHAPGPVDVVVSNPDGSSVMLAGGFTFKAASLLLSKSDVVASETLTVTWRGPHDPSDFLPCDRIGLYRAGDSSNASLWETCSGVGDQFSAQFKAPSAPGEYEVRYQMMSEYLLATVPLSVR